MVCLVKYLNHVLTKMKKSGIPLFGQVKKERNVHGLPYSFQKLLPAPHIAEDFFLNASLKIKCQINLAEAKGNAGRSHRDSLNILGKSLKVSSTFVYLFFYNISWGDCKIQDRCPHYLSSPTKCESGLLVYLFFTSISNNALHRDSWRDGEWHENIIPSDFENNQNLILFDLFVGENPAAMQSSASSFWKCPIDWRCFLLSAFSSINIIIRWHI